MAIHIHNNENISNSETSSSSEEDENASEWTQEIDRKFLETLSCLKKKDPKIYDENVTFFDGKIITTKPKPKSNTNIEKPLHLRDYERKIILEKNGVLTDEEISDDEDKSCKLFRNNSPSYVEEQKILKENLKKLLESDSGSETSDNEAKCAGFLKMKTKTSDEKVKEEEEYIEWLKGQKSDLVDKNVENELKFLHDYWVDPNLNEGEQFLRDYILNKRYLELDRNAIQESEISFSEEEKMLDDCDAYEKSYNFRFEEPDPIFIKTYPRNIESSVRRKDQKRKLKREERKRKKEKLIKEKRIELKKTQTSDADFEDLIDDIPCKFKYRQVTPNSFGLSIEEILAADDKELNNWCSLKKVDSIRPESMEKFDLKVYSKKGKDINLKKKLLPSLFNEDNKNEEFEMKEKSSSEYSKLSISNEKYKKLNEKNKSKSNAFEISDERLKAYGINPKRYKNKLKYGSNC